MCFPRLLLRKVFLLGCIWADTAYDGVALSRLNSSSVQECRGLCVQESGDCQHWTFEPFPDQPKLGGWCVMYGAEAVKSEQIAVGCISGDVFCVDEGNREI